VSDALAVTTASFLGTAGTALGLFWALSMLLQARRLLKIGTACELSIPIRVLALAGYAVWLAYGIAIKDVPLILVDLAGVAGAALVLHVTVVLRRQQTCPIAQR
jgi:uncharacterized protein with PQ loop repeat